MVKTPKRAGNNYSIERKNHMAIRIENATEKTYKSIYSFCTVRFTGSLLDEIP